MSTMTKAGFRRFCKAKGIRGKNKKKFRRVLNAREARRRPASASRALANELFPGRSKRGQTFDPTSLGNWS